MSPNDGQNGGAAGSRATDAPPYTEADSLTEPDVDSGAVELSRLTKQFGEALAVDAVDLSVAPGELLVLLGPSGCGKTTTLRMVAGLEALTSGSVSIDGRDVSETTPQERDVAMVFQNYALYPHKTVRGNIRFPLRKMDLDEATMRDRVESTASLLDIQDLLDKQPAALSGGQRQRVAVGRALARRPSVLLMDEPLSNLDAKLKLRTRSELRDLQRRLGITTIYVTHDQEEAMSIADRIAVMNHGTVEQVGTPREIYREPRSEFIASFVGDPAMNLYSTATADPLVDALTETAPERAARVGIRPEDGYVVGEDGPVGTAPASLTATVDSTVTVVEPLGRAYEVGLETATAECLIRTRDCPS
ncbi:ABC transporter ATP-binding protein [Salinirubrum litoreum]|uniref:ABC-type D-xylose/L-arabinose transporter n=1 Tax=Salinirubrum litoreum TaxID=1126234 RepID=A0ABD5RHA8_9EURY|nr:ABC transporter ATP-binding protein [Salinirubrum litoreum]